MSKSIRFEASQIDWKTDITVEGCDKMVELIIENYGLKAIIIDLQEMYDSLQTEDSITINAPDVNINVNDCEYIADLKKENDLLWSKIVSLRAELNEKVDLLWSKIDGLRTEPDEKRTYVDRIKRLRPWQLERIETWCCEEDSNMHKRNDFYSKLEEIQSDLDGIRSDLEYIELPWDSISKRLKPYARIIEKFGSDDDQNSHERDDT